MTKRFTLKLNRIYDNEAEGTVLDTILSNDEVCDLLNSLSEENKQLKNLIKTMLHQIDAEHINIDEKTMYSARIIFNREQFELIRKIWSD